jgi:hypothetical protein
MAGLVASLPEKLAGSVHAYMVLWVDGLVNVLNKSDEPLR